jgi:hypothetical protein
MHCESHTDWTDLLERLEATPPDSTALSPLVTQLTAAIERTELAVAQSIKEESSSRAECRDASSASDDQTCLAVLGTPQHLATRLKECLDLLAVLVARGLPADARRGLRCQSFEVLVDSARKTLHGSYPEFALRRLLADRGTRYELRYLDKLAPDPVAAAVRTPDLQQATRDLRQLASEVVEAVIAAREIEDGRH